MNKLKIKEKKAKHYLEKQGLIKHLKGGVDKQMKPDYPDLARLHRLVVKRKAIKILEFGVGWSTVVLAHASRITGGVVHSIDSSQLWIDNSGDLLPESLKEYVKFYHSDVEAGKFNGRICHYFKSLPDIVPDFIYLDGPDPSTVRGVINGLSWKNRNVMSADILLMEPTFFSRTFIIVDRRTNNAQFLKNNFQRNWIFRNNLHAPTFKLNDVSLTKRIIRKLTK